MIEGHLTGYVINGVVYIGADQLIKLLLRAGHTEIANAIEAAAEEIRAAA